MAESYKSCLPAVSVFDTDPCYGQVPLKHPFIVEAGMHRRCRDRQTERAREREERERAASTTPSSRQARTAGAKRERERERGCVAMQKPQKPP